MANVTFLIGNGFDINIGLKTQYTDFYEEYIKPDLSDNGLIQWFKLLLSEDKNMGWEKWSDFEKGMGVESVVFDKNKERFIKCFTDFQNKFINYLKELNNSINWNAVQNNTNAVNSFADSILKFVERVDCFDRKKIIDYINSRGVTTSELNLLQLNYTYALDKLYALSKSRFENLNSNNNILHINTYNSKTYHLHGTTDAYPIIGFDNVEQIKNEFFKKDKAITQHFLKSEKQNYQQSLNVSDLIDKNIAIAKINNSHIICLFGVSIGDTDKRWWELVGKWLKQDRLLIIFAITGVEQHLTDISKQIYYQEKRDSVKQEITSRFYRLANWTPEDIKAHGGKILIELDNRKMFNFKLPVKPSSDKNSSNTSADTSTALVTK
jgi:hypothetical protein